MWGFLGDLIYLVARIWHLDSKIRDDSRLIAGSEYDKQSRRFVARLCAGCIMLLVILGLLWSAFK